MSTVRRRKIVFCGPSSAGKTTIIQRFVKGHFYDHPSTIGTAVYACQIDVENQQVLLHIWDTAGMEQYKSLVPRYAKGASLAVFVYDVADRASFEAAKALLCDAPKLCDPETLTCFVGNKIDCDAVVDPVDAREFAQSRNAQYLETSAKTGENVKELFDYIAWRVANSSGGPVPAVDIDLKPSPPSCC
jgi:Ras-related protein Rab-5C